MVSAKGVSNMTFEKVKYQIRNGNELANYQSIAYFIIAATLSGCHVCVFQCDPTCRPFLLHSNLCSTYFIAVAI